MAIFLNRIVRAVKLDISLYTEVEADRTALGQAMVVVAIFGIAVTVGFITRRGIWSIPAGAIEIITWFVWVFLTYFVGTKLIPSHRGQMTRTGLVRAMGYATAPGIFRALGIIPVLGLLAWYVASVWMLLATIIAVKQAFAYSGIWQAVAVCVIGYVIVRILQQVLMMVVFNGSMA